MKAKHRKHLQNNISFCRELKPLTINLLKETQNDVLYLLKHKKNFLPKAFIHQTVLFQRAGRVLMHLLFDVNSTSTESPITSSLKIINISPGFYKMKNITQLGIFKSFH